MVGNGFSQILNKQVTALGVIGTERDSRGKWLGADLILEVPPLGSFVVNVVTKGHFVSERLLHTLQESEALAPEQFNERPAEVHEPFVLNSKEISDEILFNTFLGRTVTIDLAECMWPAEEDPEN